MLKLKQLFEELAGPQVIEPAAGRPSLIDSVIPDLDAFKQRLLDHGALLLRGFRVATADDFNDFVSRISAQHIKYVHRSTPREEVTGNVLTATGYPQQLDIVLHNESAYQRQWPMTVAFCCTVAPIKGGETPIAPMSGVVKSIGPELCAKFEQLGVEYVRHYHKGVDLSWQNAFQTDSRDDVHQYCAENDIRCEWLENDLLRTSHSAQGAAMHPHRNFKTYFNQSHLFHSCAMGEDVAGAMATVFGAGRLPRHSRFGDGSEITMSELTRVRDAFRANTVSFRWQPGDVMVLDNMQYAHGRRAFEGPRSVFAALMDPYPEL